MAATLRRRLAELDALIVEQKAALDKLEQDRITVDRQLSATSTFPLLTLPVEITAEIFLLCLPPIETLRNFRVSINLKTQAPTIFLGVCRTWRDIALETPALWTTLYLDLNFIDPRVASTLGEVEGWIDRWLNRAALHPLSISLHLRPRGVEDNPITPSRARDVIHRYASRVQYLELYFGQDDMRQLDLGSAVFPQLKHAVLGNDGSFEPADYRPVNVFNNAPQLRELHLIPYTVLSDYIPPSFQLTKFEGDIENLELFALAPNLTQIKCTVDYLVPLPASEISHARLESLTLDGEKDILQHLALPALQSLHISAMEDTTYPTLLSFLTRSSPPLRTLCIRVDDQKFGDWGECISCVGGTLENLELHSPSNKVQVAVFRCHSFCLDLRSPLPRLQTLSFVNSYGINYALLVRFLDERTRSSVQTRFRSFRLQRLRGSSLDDSMYSRSDIDEDYRGEKITGHLGRLAASRGVDIYIGTE
ncbi:hypothetical protein DFH09DRAFT_494198 [Mycena vulgaris]|nr:hypothetical protein DFH09DRAFT_494198 [Mycena vulgaris]